MITPTSNYLDTFQRHLRVGGWRRQEILRELRQHLAEAPSDMFGQPAKLARALDRVHLGFFRTVPRLALVPALTVMTITVIEIAIGYAHRSIASETWLGLLDTSMTLRWFIIPIIVGVLTGRQIIRFHRPVRVFLVLFAVMYVTAFIMGATADAFFGPASADVPDTIGGTFLSALYTPCIASLPAVLSTFFGVVLSRWNQFGNAERTRSLRKFQGTFAICLTLIWFYVTLVMIMGSMAGTPTAWRMGVIGPLLLINVAALGISIHKVRIGFQK